MVAFFLGLLVGALGGLLFFGLLAIGVEKDELSLSNSPGSHGKLDPN